MNDSAPPTTNEEPKKVSKKRSKKKSGKKSNSTKRRRSAFPASSFEEALTIPVAIQKYAAGQKVRRLTLFDHLGKSPDSGPSRQLVTNASKYGLIKGSYKSEHLELTPDGNLATSTEADLRQKKRAQFRLAIEQISPFKFLFDRQRGNRLPAVSILED